MSVMHEILFRGKRLDNGEWVEGIYTPCGWDIFGGRTPDPNIMIISENGKEDGLWVEIIPETVGQYTGLVDKNGVKIFEGDIVEVYKCYKYLVPEFKFGIMDPLQYWKKQKVEVLGNIHDNPELIGGDAP